MSVTDQMTKKKPNMNLRLKALSKIGEHRPFDCFQCIRCTSGCPSMKMLELKPHEIVSLVRLGFVDELVGSDMIWNCTTCLKCKERCPQEVAPVDLILALRNLTVELELKVPESFLGSVTAILETGFIQRPREALTRSLKSARMSRDKLGLPQFQEADEKFKAGFLKALEGS